MKQDARFERLYIYRVYEGELLFQCERGCPDYLIEFSFENNDEIVTRLIKPISHHRFEYCHNCGYDLEWTGYWGERPISESLMSLINSGHYMASTVILSAIIEHSLSNLLCSALVDSGMALEDANRIANGNMSRYDMLKKCRSMTKWPIDDISFPIRNLVAHGKGFGKEEGPYITDLLDQSRTIRQWISGMLGIVTPQNYMPNQTERWLLFMDHWSKWLTAFIERIAQKTTLRR